MPRLTAAFASTNAAAVSNILEPLQRTANRSAPARDAFAAALNQSPNLNPNRTSCHFAEFVSPKTEQNRTISNFIQNRPRCTNDLQQQPARSFDSRGFLRSAIANRMLAIRPDFMFNDPSILST